MPKKPRRPKGTRSVATPDPAGSYAPPHADSGAFGSATFGSGLFGGGAPVPERKHAPEPIAQPSIDATPISYSEQPPPPNPAVVTGPVVVQDRLEVGATSSKSPVEMLSTPIQSPTEQVARELRIPPRAPQNATEFAARQAREYSLRPGIDRAAAVLSLRALITVFDEVEQYDSLRHHNQPPPALWIDDADYLQNIKDLVHELRRLNDLLEAEATEVNEESIAKTGSIVGAMAEKASMTAAAVVGGGVGALFVASVYTLISYTDAGAEVLNRLPLIGKGK